VNGEEGNLTSTSFALVASSSSQRSKDATDEDQAFLHQLLAIPNPSRRRDWVREASDPSASRERGIREDEFRF